MPFEDLRPTWATPPLVAADAAIPLRVQEYAKGNGVGLSGAIVAENPSMIGSVQQAKVYLTDAEKTTLGIT